MKRSIACAPLLLLVACSGIQSPLAPRGDQAAALHNLLLLSLIVCGSVYALVLAGLGWSIVRKRAEAQTADPAAHQPALDRGLWIAAGIILIGLTILIIATFVADRALFSTRGKDAVQVRVTGHQFWWRVQYRDPTSGRWIETANELHLPRDRVTRVELGSADVIHSFWVPNVSGKIDMVPGRRNLIDLTPRQAGWFRGQCAEFCGLQHAHMAFGVEVEPPAAFDAWLAGQARPAATATSAAGASVFVSQCGACHAVRGTPAAGRAGPDLTHVASRRSVAAGTLPMSRGNLQGWIAQPQAIKPGTSMPTIPLTPADANAVADYLASLR